MKLEEVFKLASGLGYQAVEMPAKWLATMDSGGDPERLLLPYCLAIVRVGRLVTGASPIRGKVPRAASTPSYTLF